MIAKITKTSSDTLVSCFGGKTHRPFRSAVAKFVAMPNNADLLRLIFDCAPGTLRQILHPISLSFVITGKFCQLADVRLLPI
jgi:hypothetical protein